jgi:hypothetical protein
MNIHQTLAAELDFPAYLLGALILIVVMIFHGVMLLQISKRYEVKSYLLLAQKKFASVSVYFYVCIFLLFITHIAEIVIWGLALYLFKLLPNLGDSILFAGSTYTAMGFMEDILPSGWKMLAVIIAFSGMFAFAWTASVMISMTKNFRQAYTKMHMEKLKLPSEIIDRFH